MSLFHPPLSLFFTSSPLILFSLLSSDYSIKMHIWLQHKPWIGWARIVTCLRGSLGCTARPYPPKTIANQILQLQQHRGKNKAYISSTFLIFCREINYVHYVWWSNHPIFSLTSSSFLFSFMFFSSNYIFASIFHNFFFYVHSKTENMS